MADLTIDESVLRGIAILVGLPVLGAIVQHLWTRYRQRLAQLRWTSQYQAMAFATHDFGWGKVDILYDEKPTGNLHMAYVQLQNASSRDLQNVQVNVAANQDTVVLRSAGQLRGSVEYFPLAPAYGAILEQTTQRELSELEIRQWAGRSDFLIPVLNRGAIADFRLLLSRIDYAAPEVTLYCDHVGITLKHQPLAEETWGVRDNQALSLGIPAGILITVVAALSNLPAWGIAAIGWSTGAMALLIGVIIVRFWRLLGSLAD